MTNIPNKTLIILRSVSGAGKTTFANFLKESLKPTNNTRKHGIDHAADYYHEDENGNYKFDINKLGFAHIECRSEVENSMLFEDPIIVVSNTSTTEKELEPYLTLAKKHNYRVFSLIVENRHGNKNTHNVPEKTLERQEQNIKNSLKLR